MESVSHRSSKFGIATQSLDGGRGKSPIIIPTSHSFSTYLETKNPGLETYFLLHLCHRRCHRAVKTALDGEGLFGAAQNLLRRQIVNDVVLENLIEQI